MIVVGLGVGPSFAVFTVLVGTPVAPREAVGVATASLTFFQQIGGTVGLTIAGTALAGKREDRDDWWPTACRSRWSISSLPGAVSSSTYRHRRPRRADPGGGPRTVPPAGRADHAADRPGGQKAFAIAIASTFWCAIAAAVLAAVFVLFLRESEIRGTALARGTDADA